MRNPLNIKEELKNQLGEQVPGAMEAFRKAAEKFIGKDLDMKGFLKLMQDGKLLSKDILPLAAEEMAKMARNLGGWISLVV